ncbi:MAG TPA: DHA2 family efflux MFS transporter permease subunit [Actinocatenispora sp.]
MTSTEMPAVPVGRGRWWALAALGLAMLAVGLDVTILNVALPTMSGELNAGLSDLQWFADGYTLAMAAMLLPAGLLGDRFGRKRILLGALVVFGAASTWCAFADSPGELIAARVALGVAAAFVTPLGTSVFLVLFPEPAERTRAMAVTSSAMMIGLPLGPILGGLLLKHFWWGSVFLINVPLVLIGLVAVAILVPESRNPRRPRLDLVGVLGASAGLVALTYGVIEAGEKGWGSAYTLVPLVGGVVVLAGLVAWERRVRDPLVDLRLFRSRGFAWGSLFSVLVSFAMFGLMFFLPLYYQAVQGSDTLGTGLKLLPMIGGVLIGASVAGRLPATVGSRTVPAVGFGLAALGLFLGATTSLTTGYGFTAVWLVIMGAGLGLAMTRTMTAALNDLSTEAGGVGSALLQALRSVGGAIGVALLGTFANSGYRDHLDLPATLPGPAAEAVRGSVSAGVTVAKKIGDPALLDSVRSAFVHAMDTTLWVCGGIAAVSALLAAIFLGVRVGRTEAEDRPSELTATRR